VKGPFNAVTVYGGALGRSMFVGRGAGQMPTAAAVVADLLSIALGGYERPFASLQTFPDVARPADVLDFGRTQHRYYLRLSADDAPGVLADVTRCLGDAGISLTAVLQHEPRQGEQSVPVIVTTHVAREASVRSAVAAIDALPSVDAPSTVLRIVDMPREDRP
jgi:homoserine dehydrogenase